MVDCKVLIQLLWDGCGGGCCYRGHHRQHGPSADLLSKGLSSLVIDGQRRWSLAGIYILSRSCCIH